jgi:hypothetical protein
MNHFVSKISLSLLSAHNACISFLDVALAFDVKRDKYCIKPNGRQYIFFILRVTEQLNLNAYYIQDEP